MIKNLQQIIDHKTACDILQILARRLEIETPTDPKMVRFFGVKLENTVMANRKQAASGAVLIDALRAAVNGR